MFSLPWRASDFPRDFSRGPIEAIPHSPFHHATNPAFRAIFRAAPLKQRLGAAGRRPALESFRAIFRAAPLKLRVLGAHEVGVVIAFRAIFRAAPLKRGRRGVGVGSPRAFPRDFSRGPIEAYCAMAASASRAADFPRDFSRGPIEAAVIR